MTTPTPGSAAADVAGLAAELRSYARWQRVGENHIAIRAATVLTRLATPTPEGSELREAVARTVLEAWRRFGEAPFPLYDREAEDIADALLSGPIAGIVADHERMRREKSYAGCGMATWTAYMDEVRAELPDELRDADLKHAIRNLVIGERAMNRGWRETSAALAEARKALTPFKAAWEACGAVGDQGGGFVEDDAPAWVSSQNGKGPAYVLFKFADLRRAAACVAGKEVSDVG